MLKKINIIREILKRKNAQIRAEREKLMAAEVQNQIYASYILCLANESGEARISKSRIADTVGKYKAEVSATEDEYIIRVRELTAAEKKTYAEGSATAPSSAGAGAVKADKTGGEGIEKN
jgi:hypothetical protein